MTQVYELSTYDCNRLNYNQIALGWLPMPVIRGYIIQTIVNLIQIKIDKNNPLQLIYILTFFYYNDFRIKSFWKKFKNFLIIFWSDLFSPKLQDVLEISFCLS